MSTSLEDVKSQKPEPSAEEAAAKELVRLARGRAYGWCIAALSSDVIARTTRRDGPGGTMVGASKVMANWRGFKRGAA